MKKLIIMETLLVIIYFYLQKKVDFISPSQLVYVQLLVIFSHSSSYKNEWRHFSGDLPFYLLHLVRYDWVKMWGWGNRCHKGVPLLKRNILNAPSPSMWVVRHDVDVSEPGLEPVNVLHASTSGTASPPSEGITNTRGSSQDLLSRGQDITRDLVTHRIDRTWWRQQPLPPQMK